MHKSRLGTLIIDCKTQDLEGDAGFWSAALGGRASAPDAEGRYIAIEADPAEPQVILQRVDHDSRVHLDIETDDIGAEVARLERLGATVVDVMPRWTVMQAPRGHRFCVIGARREGFDQKANIWSG